MGERIQALRKKRGLSLEKFGKQFGVSREMVGQWERDESAPKTTRQQAIANLYGVTLDWLSGKDVLPDPHTNEHAFKTVAGRNQKILASEDGDGRTEEFDVLTEPVYIIGEVQAGAWREAIHFEESERRKMNLPPDADYPGIKRYALKNVGESMNRECAHGGYWVFVRLEDLTGIGPAPGDFVIVQRSRHGGQEFEATCKRLEIRGGKPWLCPYSFDPSFEPIPFAGDQADEMQVIGIVTDVVNKPGRRR